MLWLVWSTNGGGAMWIDVALSVLLLQYDDHGLVGTTWSIMMICLVNLCVVWAYQSICEVMSKYVFFLGRLSDHVDCDFVFLCVVLGMIHRYY